MFNIIPRGIFSTRFVIAIMLFTACFITYMNRVNMSINILAMVVPEMNSNGDIKLPECTVLRMSESNSTEVPQQYTNTPDYGPRYEWSSKIQNLVIGSYFWGYIITCIPGGYLAERFGATKVVMISTLISGGLTILSPLLASAHYMALIASRFLIGLSGGVIYPSLHCLVAKWAPPQEKGRFVGALLGGALGTVITWPLLGVIIEAIGWSWSFFINGGIVLFWCILWVVLVRDSPEIHPRISEEEKKFITQSLGDTVKETKGLPPYTKMAVSLPFLAFVILHFGNLWGLYFLMTAGPNFLSTVLGFNLGHTGILASLPYLARLIFGFLFGMLGDYIKAKKLIPTNIVRKGFVFFSHVIPGVLLLILNLTGCDIIWTLVLIIFSLGSNGAATLTNLTNAQDLAPNYAGTVYGIANCIGSFTGFLNPLIVGEITAKNNGLAEWHIIFSIGAVVYIVCGAIFCLFGSAEIQKWNYCGEASNERKDGVPNPGFDNSSETTVKVEDVLENSENTKV